jgi:hypothetical protein
VLAAVAYAVLRTASDAFYGPLGLSPEEAGLDQAQLLARAVGTLLLPLFFAAPFAIVALELYGLSAIGEIGSFSRPAQWIGGVVFAASVLLAVTIAEGFFVGVVVVLCAMGIPKARRSVAGHLPIALIASGLLIVLYLGLLAAAAILNREAVKDGDGLSAIDRLYAPWDASVATVRWIGGSPEPPTTKDLPCAMYLGTVDGAVLLYDPRDETLMRIPADKVNVRTWHRPDSYCTPQGPEIQAPQEPAERQ